jgi:hypothetical protein
MHALVYADDALHWFFSGFSHSESGVHFFSFDLLLGAGLQLPALCTRLSVRRFRCSYVFVMARLPHDLLISSPLRLWSPRVVTGSLCIHSFGLCLTACSKRLLGVHAHVYDDAGAHSLVVYVYVSLLLAGSDGSECMS